MFNLGGKRSAVPAGADKIESVIGRDAYFKGVLQSQSSIRIDGVIEGEIQAAGHVRVGETGKVIAKITAADITVSGVVRGDIIASGHLELTAKGKIWGDVTAATFSIEEGGLFRGQSLMQGEPPADLLPATAPSTPGSTSD